jgi:hypothetical protein
MPMKRILILAALLLLLTILALRADREQLLRLYRSVPRPSPNVDLVLDGVAWRQAVAWKVSDGPFPGAWSWGDWRVVDGVLEGRDDEGDFAVYMLPFEHGADFLLETRVRILADSGGRVAEAHLLTRDGRELRRESGAVLFGGQSRVSVRHMVDRVEYVLRVIKPSRPVSEGDWHLLRFAVHNGRVQVWLDGARIFRSEKRYPTGVYREPHFAVRNGVVQFSEFRLLVDS